MKKEGAKGLSALKRKSSIALLIGIIVMLLLIPIWYMMLVPYLIASALENIDSTTTLEGTLGKKEYAHFLKSVIALGFEEIDSTTILEGYLYSMEYGPYGINVTMKAHAYTEAVKGENIVMKVDNNMTRSDTIRLQNTTAIDPTNPVCTRWDAISYPDVKMGNSYHIESWKDNNKDGKLGSSDQIKMWGTDEKETMNWTRWYDVVNVTYGTTCYMDVTNETIPRFSVSLTYVFNKFTRKHLPDAPEEYPDSNRTGYGASLYPSHLKAGENIPNVWIDNFNRTETLEYKESIVVGGVTLYRYFLNKSVTQIMNIPEFGGPTNMTLSLTRTILIEPLMGAPAYIENETFTVDRTGTAVRFVRLSYKFSDESIAEGIENAKTAHDGMEQLELLYGTTPIRIDAHAYTEAVRGNNIIMKVENTMTRTDTNETLEDFSGSLTYVFNKFTRKHVPDAPEERPNSNRTGYGASLYPSHLKPGENIPNVWIDSLNTTGTLEYVGKEEKDGVTLYRYFLAKSVTKTMDLPSPIGLKNCTLTSTRTILIEPLMGAPAYIENETFSFNLTRQSEPDIPFVYLTYRFSDESIAEGIENAKTAYNGAQLTEIYIPTIFGVVAIILTVGLAFNVRRLRRKKPPEPKT